MDLSIAGRDIDENIIRVGDKVELLFPFTSTICEVKKFDRGIFPDSIYQSIYGQWLKHCKKVVS